jgi:glycolate oxidase
LLSPATAQEISSIVKLANQQLIPVIPRGGGTGLSGGALPVYGGICISMERFKNIVEIDEENLQATVEPGVITQVLSG